MAEHEWLSLPEAVYEAAGLLTRWQIYTAAMERRIESQRKGSRWLVRRASVMQYITEIRTEQMSN